MSRVRFPYNARLALLAAVLCLLWFGGGFRLLNREETRAWDTVRNGQRTLWAAQSAAGVPLAPEEDKLRTGFIGAEWSALTTTLGEIGAKRTSCNPLWAARYLAWFDELGLREGDRIVVYSSSSFPAFLFSALAAAETRGLEVMLAVSLGSSTWGANRVEFPWPAMARVLRESGYMRTPTVFYTPGGTGETGRDFPEETMTLLRGLAASEGVPLWIPADLRDAVRGKTERMLAFKPKLFVSIGGSNANMGDSELGVEIPNGLLLPGKADPSRLGDGVIAEALREGIPVLHMLNVRKLALDGGIPWDAGVFVKAWTGAGPLVAALGLAIFFAVLLTYRRWRWEDDGRG